METAKKIENESLVQKKGHSSKLNSSDIYLYHEVLQFMGHKL
jgi:hypothetical protein